MQKVAPTTLQRSVIAVFSVTCLGLALFLWTSFGGSLPLQAKGYRFEIAFPQADALAVQADVRISGVTVGTVVALRPTRAGETIATVQLQPRYAPIHADARAVLRTKTLLGETYVALTPGSPDAPAVADGGLLGPAQVAQSVQLDEIYRTFDARTRAAFQLWLQASAAGVTDDGPALNAALGELAPFTADLERVSATLQGQNAAVARLVRNGGVVLAALTERDHQLRDLITTSREAFGATDAASADLAAAFVALPTFEARSQVALRRLDVFTADASPLIAQLTPSAAALTPALQRLQTLTPNLERLVVGLGPLTTAARTGLPALDGVLGELPPLLGALGPVLRDLNPVFAYSDLYQPEIEAFLANTAAISEASAPTTNENPSSTSLLHYVRGLAGPVSPGSLALQTSRYGVDRANAYPAPGAFNRLASGLATHDTSSCANPTPGISGPPNATVSQDTLGLIEALGIDGAGSGSGVAAPPCVGLTSSFPHVVADAR